MNRDGRVSILDLILVAQQLGKRVPANSPVDLNRDGVVSILDLILAAQAIADHPPHNVRCAWDWGGEARMLQR